MAIGTFELEVRVYVANLAKYNEGKLVGEWIDLPADEEEIEEVIQEVLGNDEEWEIHDYESNVDIKINNFKNVYELSETIEDINIAIHRNGIDEDVFKMLINHEGIHHITTMLENGEFRVYRGVNNFADVARDYLSESGLFSMILDGMTSSVYDSNQKRHMESLSDTIEQYFDFEAYGEQMEVNGLWITDFHNGIAIEIF